MIYLLGFFKCLVTLPGKKLKERINYGIFFTKMIEIAMYVIANTVNEIQCQIKLNFGNYKTKNKNDY